MCEGVMKGSGTAEGGRVAGSEVTGMTVMDVEGD